MQGKLASFDNLSSKPLSFSKVLNIFSLYSHLLSTVLLSTNLCIDAYFEKSRRGGKGRGLGEFWSRKKTGLFSRKNRIFFAKMSHFFPKLQMHLCYILISALLILKLHISISLLYKSQLYFTLLISTQLCLSKIT